MAKLYRAATDATDVLNGLQVWLQQTFYPANDVSSLLLNEILNALATVIVALAAWAGGPEVVATADVVAGGVVAFELWNVDNDDSAKKQMTAIEL